MISATAIPVFENLAQFNYDNKYYDFHNDYSCEKITYSNGILSIVFKHLTDTNVLSLVFNDVVVPEAVFFNSSETAGLTIENIYRGRFEFNGQLMEISEDGLCYFYLEFYEGQQLEFWAGGIRLLK